ncbi:hypothetical protein AcW1_004675 [Taiwanofungus camphoratus]|nr:hypothetical protein AcW1_004675 [Antrodia cinnamomea]
MGSPHQFDSSFINYLTQEDAERAARRLNGKILLGNIVEAVPYFQDMNPRGHQMPTRRSRDRFCSLQNRGGRPGEETCGQPTLSGVHVRHGAYDKSFVPYRTRLSCEYSMRSDKHSSRSECPPIWPHPKLERGEYQESDSVPHLSDNGCTDIDRIAAWCLGRDHDRKPRVY